MSGDLEGRLLNTRIALADLSGERTRDHFQCLAQLGSALEVCFWIACVAVDAELRVERQCTQKWQPKPARRPLGATAAEDVSHPAPGQRHVAHVFDDPEHG